MPVIDVDWAPSDDELTDDRLHPNADGYARYARLVATQLVGGQPCTKSQDQLRALIAEKNQLFFHRYRPQNETYLFLFRKHEQGNNAGEIPRFDPLIKQADESIWRASGP